MVAVHPHTRGEHGVRIPANTRDSGSSPHPWGTPSTAGTPKNYDRFIPTPVGNTKRANDYQLAVTVHPHTRGEHKEKRGRNNAKTVHPHTRGEHAIQINHIRYSCGSSPHPWGTRLKVMKFPALNWFIPTPVGNTSSRYCVVNRNAVHPHTRGEHNDDPIKYRHCVGSSPHPWGTRQSKTAEDGRRRFIPTPVGNTGARRSEIFRLTVHPHTRGEHGTPLPVGWSITGSSPHPWGTPRPRLQDASVRRFIPTPVGNTGYRGIAIIWITVHPHTRGEHISLILGLQRSAGSSPHPWGTRSIGNQ